MNKCHLFLLAALLLLPAVPMRAIGVERCDTCLFNPEVSSKIKYVDVAKSLKDSFGVDDDGELVRTVVFDCPGMSKAEIYLEAYNWITNKFNGGSPDIQLADKDLSSIIARTVIKGAAVSNTVWLKFSADLKCLLRVDAKEGRCRLSITVQEYVFSGADMPKFMPMEKVRPDLCFPFIDENTRGSRRMGAMSYVQAYNYCNLLICKMHRAILKRGNTTPNAAPW